MLAALAVPAIGTAAAAPGKKKISADGKVGPNTWYYLRTPGA
ncbi:hypothetical protein [Streptomyces sp. URMC 124]